MTYISYAPTLKWRTTGLSGNYDVLVNGCCTTEQLNLYAVKRSGNDWLAKRFGGPFVYFAKSGEEEPDTTIGMFKSLHEAVRACEWHQAQLSAVAVQDFLGDPSDYGFQMISPECEAWAKARGYRYSLGPARRTKRDSANCSANSDSENNSQKSQNA